MSVRVYLGPGVLRGRRLQPAGVADPPDPGHQGRRGRLHRVGPPRGGAPAVAAVLAAGEMSESYARTDLHLDRQAAPEDSREVSDEILLTAAGNGMGLPDLAGLARG